MKILDIQQGIEESLASLATSVLPPGLEGLRQLPISDRNPQVSIRYWDNGRKVRENAAASYLDPDRCEVVIRFVAFEGPQEEGDSQESGESGSASDVGASDFETPLDQLLEVLREVEGTRQFVGLMWFRDQVRPQCPYGWAQDQAVRGSVLRHATNQRLVLTRQVPNPTRPHHPVTAIRVNRRHARFWPKDAKRVSRFAPVRIRGGSISETVLGERR